MLRIAHLSDLHFGPPYVPRVGEALQRMLHRLEPDVIVVSGDFTQRAKADQFTQARAYLDAMPDVPRVVVPGNHDVPLWRIWERLVRPRELYRQYINAELDGVLRMDGAVFAWLDSTSPRRAISNGRIHLDQLNFCRRAFRDVPPDTLRILVAHHHFLPAPDFVRDRPMPRAKRALDVLVDLRVDMILGGHLHRSYIGNTLDVYAGADPNHGSIIVQCGTSTSQRGRGSEREKNTFNLIEAQPGGFTVTHHLYFHDSKAFEPTSRHVFPRPGRGSFSEPLTSTVEGD